MSILHLSPGRDVPNDFNVVIEIPANGGPVKYEVDKETGALLVDRFLNVAMHYPCNYGYIPNTLSEDDDPVDVLVLTPASLLSGSIIRCRPVGMLEMTDESGIDTKILAVPQDKVCLDYRHVKTPADLPPHLLAMITHFFERYKELDEGKWVKVEGWQGPEAARQVIIESVKRAKEKV